MTYTAKYRKVGSFFWKKITGIKGDFITSEFSTMRVFILQDETRIEVPLSDIEFVFCPKRFIVIKQNMETELGHSIPIKG